MSQQYKSPYTSSYASPGLMGPGIERMPALAGVRFETRQLAGTVELPDDKAHELGEILAQRSRSLPFAAIDLKNALEPYTTATRKKIVKAYVAADGDADKLDTVQQWGVTWELPREVKIRLTIWGILSTVSMAASAYHGYKRNDSIGWALGWGFLGAMFPVITPTIAIAQGFGKPKK